MLTAAYLDMLPWIVFAAVVRKDGLGLATGAAAAAATAGAIMVVARRRRRPDPLAVGGLVWFLLVLAAALAAGHSFQPPGAARCASSFVLGVAALASLRHTPLACTYLADDVAPRVRRSSLFATVSRQVTAIWAAAALVTSLSFGLLAVFPGGVDLTVLAWIVPLVVGAGTVAWAGERCQSLLVLSAAEPASERLTGPVGLWDSPFDRTRRPVPAAAADPPRSGTILAFPRPRRGRRHPLA